MRVIVGLISQGCNAQVVAFIMCVPLGLPRACAYMFAWACELMSACVYVGVSVHIHPSWASIRRGCVRMCKGGYVCSYAYMCVHVRVTTWACVSVLVYAQVSKLIFSTLTSYLTGKTTLFTSCRRWDTLKRSWNGSANRRQYLKHK